jgi:hypothetical protein
VSRESHGDSTDRSDTPESGAASLVRFFRSLSPAAHAEYRALAALDLEYGEDVVAERRANPEKTP